jgi:glycosyltransferase involved in cell wall biosynthesis
MRVLFIHNKYLQAGGEDAVVRDERELLRGRGIEVQNYERDNVDIADLSRLRVAADTIWSRRSNREVGAVLDRYRPDVVHCHNTFPLVSPSVYQAASERGIPVVQSLHNFRLACPQAFLLRDDKPCEDCVGTLPWRSVVRRCYHGSATQSAVLAVMIGVNRAIGTYQKSVTRYIALNEFCRSKFVQSGLPAERIVVKPNFVDLPPVPVDAPRSGALFVGRLSREKGIHAMAGALGALRPSKATLDVIGDGPDAGVLSAIDGVRMHGRLSCEQTYGAMSRAAYLLMPSIWYENFPRVLVEAFACCLPVITSRLGAMAELVEDGRTGLLAEPGDAASLADKISWANAHPAAMREMGQAARRHYEEKYTGDVNFARLTAIYRQAIAEERQ